MSDIAKTAAMVQAVREVLDGQRLVMPERSRLGMSAALGLPGFDTPRPYVYGEARVMLFEDVEGKRIEAMKLRAQQEHDAREQKPEGETP